MAGEAAARGVTAMVGTDLVRNAPAAINDIADDLAKLIPYVGAQAGNTDANGYALITHGLGFQPSAVFVVNVAGLGLTGTNPVFLVGVDTLGPLQFRIRLFDAPGGSLQPVAAAYSIKWLAFR